MIVMKGSGQQARLLFDCGSLPEIQFLGWAVLELAACGRQFAPT